jgi:hypothetical protein
MTASVGRQKLEEKARLLPNPCQTAANPISLLQILLSLLHVSEVNRLNF